MYTAVKPFRTKQQITNKLSVAQPPSVTAILARDSSYPHHCFLLSADKLPPEIRHLHIQWCEQGCIIAIATWMQFDSSLW